MSETRPCPNESAHGNPFRYCACGWVEQTASKSTRSPEIQHLLSLFAYEHLPEHLKAVSRQSSSLAVQMIEQLEDGPELREGLRQLLYAKDCFVRQAVADNPVPPKPKGPSGIDWQQRISTALGVRPGEVTYPLEEAIEKIRELRA